jgi:hypothetical protein
MSSCSHIEFRAAPQVNSNGVHTEAALQLLVSPHGLRGFLWVGRHLQVVSWLVVWRARARPAGRQPHGVRGFPTSWLGSLVGGGGVGRMGFSWIEKGTGVASPRATAPGGRRTQPGLPAPVTTLPEEVLLPVTACSHCADWGFRRGPRLYFLLN